MATRVPDSPGSGHSPRWSEGRATSACECGLAGEVGCAGELARDLCTRAATSMSKLGLMSLEVDRATRGAPCSCSADVSRSSRRANVLGTTARHPLVIRPCHLCGTLQSAGPVCSSSGRLWRGRARRRRFPMLISRRVSQTETCVTCFVPPACATSPGIMDHAPSWPPCPMTRMRWYPSPREVCP